MVGGGSRAVVCWLCIAALLCGTFAHALQEEQDQHSKGPTMWERVMSVHKSLLGAEPIDVPTVDTKFMWDFKNIGALVIACVCASLANAAGIGGGPFYVPLFNTVLGFDLRLSTPLSHTLMASSAVGSTIYALYQESPVDPNRPMVNLDIALTFIPILLFGNSLGVLIGGLIPEWLQTVLLTLCLVFVTCKTGLKGWSTFRKEQNERALERSSSTQPLLGRTSLNLARQPSLNRQGSLMRYGSASSYHTALTLQEEDEDQGEGSGKEAPKKAMVEEELKAPKQDVGLLVCHELSEVWRRFPLSQFIQLMVLWLVFMGLQLAKSFSPLCSDQYWAFWVSQVVLCAGTCAMNLFLTARRLKTNPQSVDAGLRIILQGKEDENARRQSTFERLGTVVTMMMLAGLIAGLLGVGGALVFNPYLLELGVHAQVTAATSVLMILFSSGSILLSFAFQHLLNTSYVTVFVPFCFVASFLGSQVVAWMINKTRRPSIIIFILTGMLIAGALATGVLGGILDTEHIREGRSPIGFSDLCPKPGHRGW